MMLRAKVVVGLSYKLKSHIPKWGNEPNVVMERGGKVRGVRKELKFSLVCTRHGCCQPPPERALSRIRSCE